MDIRRFIGFITHRYRSASAFSVFVCLLASLVFALPAFSAPRDLVLIYDQDGNLESIRDPSGGVADPFFYDPTTPLVAVPPDEAQNSLPHGGGLPAESFALNSSPRHPDPDPAHCVQEVSVAYPRQNPRLQFHLWYSNCGGGLFRVCSMEIKWNP